MTLFLTPRLSSLLDLPRHRRRHDHGAQPHRVDGYRGRGPQPRHRDDRARAVADLRLRCPPRARSPCSTTPSTASSPTPRRARDGSCCSSPSSTASPKGCCSAARYAAVPARVAVPVTTAVYTTTSMASGNLMFGLSALLLGTLVGMERRASGGVLAPSCRTSPGRSRCCSCCETSSADRVDPPAGDTQIRHQVEVPGPLLNGPVTLAVIQPP